ncbi:MAG: hypothetical protein CR982_06085 [Candidatus Cloacimonadota bacterium]|nr:MAG: hypothetical protein CR982_06085 [Candidatus Cloacimonadota bacterium]PIE78089.1 MAG: hypothetical protein CSA15_09645 [Candidatus Delongbacteria bacterium]
MDDFIPIIIFILIGVFSSLNKKMKAKKQGLKPKKKPKTIDLNKRGSTHKSSKTTIESVTPELYNEESLDDFVNIYSEKSMEKDLFEEVSQEREVENKSSEVTKKELKKEKRRGVKVSNRLLRNSVLMKEVLETKF